MRCVIQWFWHLGKPASPLPVLLLGAAVMFSIQLYRFIDDVDIFWQLKLGELTLAHGLPANEPFLAGKEDAPLAVVAWLSQVIYAAVRLLGGWPLLRLVDAAVWFGGFYIVAMHCSRRCRNDWPALVGLFVGWFAAIPFASIRPQSWAVLCFGLLIVLVRCEWSPRRKLILGTLLLIAWQNLHPSIIIAIGYLGVYAAFDWWKFHFRKSNAENNTSRWLNSILALIAVLATVLTPAGFSIFAISQYNSEISKERGITEWQTMWKYGLKYGRDQNWTGVTLEALWENGAIYGRDHACIAFAVTVPLFVVIAGLRSRRVRLADVIVILGLTAVTLIMHRFILFWGVAVIPIWADALSFPSSPTPRNRWRIPIAIVAILFAILPPMITFPAPFYDYYPFAATNALKAKGFRGTIYCDYFWGGVLADAGYPDWKVTHDGRYYLFSREEWKLYDETAAGLVPLNEVLTRFHPAAFVLRKGDDDDLIKLLRIYWTIVFEDAQSIVFIASAIR